ncbi:hypothetical protein L915_06822, partial [Phytophthora nicotianae]
ELLHEFQVQFCGLGVSVARPYYHARKRVDETPLEYLHRLNVAGLRAKLRVKSGPSDATNSRCCVSPTLVRWKRYCGRGNVRRTVRDAHTHFGSSKYRQKAASSDATKSAPTRKVQAVVTTNQPEPSDLPGCNGRIVANPSGCAKRTRSDHVWPNPATARLWPGSEIPTRTPKWFKQAKTERKINNVKANLLLDSGAEVAILDVAFARKVEYHVDESQQQECVGIGEGVYVTKGRTKIKFTLAGSLVYFFDVWVGEMTGQDAILGMDFMVPAGIRLDLADRTFCLPDEIPIQLSGRRPLYGEHVSAVRLEELEVIEAGQKIEIPLRSKSSEKLWLTRREH